MQHLRHEAVGIVLGSPTTLPASGLDILPLAIGVSVLLLGGLLLFVIARRRKRL